MAHTGKGNDAIFWNTKSVLLILWTMEKNKLEPITVTHSTKSNLQFLFCVIAFLTMVSFFTMRAPFLSWPSWHK